jgi:hypothetical protein
MLAIGTPAPAFSLPDQNGTIHTLEHYKGKKIIQKSKFEIQNNLPQRKKVPERVVVDAQAFRGIDRKREGSLQITS